MLYLQKLLSPCLPKRILSQKCFPIPKQLAFSVMSDELCHHCLSPGAHTLGRPPPPPPLGRAHVVALLPRQQQPHRPQQPPRARGHHDLGLRLRRPLDDTLGLRCWSRLLCLTEQTENNQMRKWLLLNEDEFSLRNNGQKPKQLMTDVKEADCAKIAGNMGQKQLPR